MGHGRARCLQRELTIATACTSASAPSSPRELSTSWIQHVRRREFTTRQVRPPAGRRVATAYHTRARHGCPFGLAQSSPARDLARARINAQAYCSLPSFLSLVGPAKPTGSSHPVLRQLITGSHSPLWMCSPTNWPSRGTHGCLKSL
ncbi:hypothetical protein AXF42_Ash001846 [Apostasia shenzhenica]|uniref:Uncharacterized protein n=1 Tax=Apostasia shenzhenica TaxID=1088818 RepID=A0A2I0ABH8_9ASPA|nr:hypothetical protein AXF42_Ash001846 [Apostasia shenzhenica]